MSTTGTDRTHTAAHTTTGVDGLANTRTRLVGARTGPVADVVVVSFRVLRGIGGAIARVARAVGAVVSPLGWVVIVLTPLLLLAWVGWGLEEAAAAGFVGLLLVVVGLLSLLGRGRLEARVALDHPRITVGDPASAALVITNPHRRRLLGTVIEVPVGDTIATLSIPPLAHGASIERRVGVPTRRRGLVRIGPVRATRSDPLRLLHREIDWADAIDVVVHPRTVDVPSTSTGLIRDLEGVPTRDLTSSDLSFHALREYQPGDDRRYIHWRSTAKTGVYMVRQFEQTRRSHLVVGLALAEGDYADQDEFELAVSAAGSLGVRAIRDGRNVSVVVGETTPEFARRRVYGVRPLSTARPERLLDDLAVVETVPTSLGIRDIGRVVADTVTGVSIAYLVCGSTVAPTDLRAATAAFPPDVDVIAVVCDPDAKPGLRRMAGLNVLRVGYLEDLRAALVRAQAVA